MRYEVDEKNEIVTLYIEDSDGEEIYERLTFKEFKELADNIIWNMKNPTGP